MSVTRQNPTDDFIRIQDLYRLCIGKWHWFVISLIVTLGIATVYLLRTPPVYTRSASLLVQEEGKGQSLAGDIGSTFADMGLFQANTNVNNELISLQSPAVMQDVVRRLRLDVGYATDGRFYRRLLYGQDYFYEYLLNLRFKISPFSFFQTNTLGAEVLYEKVGEYVGDTKDKLIYDLYTGTGTIAQMMAPYARKVVGVEIVEEAVEAARRNALDNNLTNCEFIAGDVLKVVDNLTEKPDMIILDPPRDGVNPKALRKIIRFGVDEMVYVSCKPTSLMRDLLMLQEAGYEVKRCCLVDMFPMTTGVETVVLLSKLNTKQHIEVELNLDELDLTAAESKATYDEIEAYVLEHTGLKVSHLYIAQVKQKYGIIDAADRVEGFFPLHCPG